MADIQFCNFKLIDNTNITTLPSPSNIVFGKETISKEQRTMDGTMHIDYIASKNSYELSWNYLKYKDLDKIKKIVENTTSFFKFEYSLKPNNDDESVLIDQTVYLKKLEYYPYFYEKGFDWRDVTLTLVEK